MKALCIGGPLDGNIAPHSNVSDGGLGSQFDYMHNDTNTVYTLRAIKGPGVDIYFYTADGVTEHGAIVRVFTAYARKNGK